MDVQNSKALASTNKENTPLHYLQNIPLYGLGQCTDVSIIDSRIKRRYTKAQELETLAVSKYQASGAGITFKDLMKSRLVLHKKQARITLKHCLRKNILFTYDNHRPQQYYPARLKSEILKAKSLKNIPIQPTGVNPTSNSPSSPTHPVSNAMQHQKAQSFLDILMHLAYTPLYIHKVQLMLSIDKQYYRELCKDERHKNRAKIQEELIGRRRVTYTISPKGTVEIAVGTTDTPFKLESDEDESVIFSFLGQVRDRLLYLLKDVRERKVPQIMEWTLKGCDLNKDIEADDKAQLTLPDIQLRSADKVFRLYIKILKGKAFCRGEESLKLDSIPLVEALGNIRHPYKSIEQKIDFLTNKLDQHIEEMNTKLQSPGFASMNNKKISEGGKEGETS